MDIINSAILDLKSKNKYPTDDDMRFEGYPDFGLYGACEGGHLDIVNLMIEHGAYNFDSALYNACKSGHMNIINLIIEKGVNHFHFGLEGACEGGNLNVINLMIQKCGLYPNWGLYGACKGGHLDIVNLMVEKGATDWNGGLDSACKGGHLNIIKLMIKYGAYNFTPLFDIINSDIVDLIIKKNIPFECYVEYPEDKIKIFKLYESGLSIDNFNEMHGFNDLIKDIEERQNTVKHVLNDHLIDDLIEIVGGYIIN